MCVDSFPTQPLNNHLDLPDAGAPKMRLELYDPETYQRLPSIYDAVAKFDSIDGDSIISTTVRGLSSFSRLSLTNINIAVPERHDIAHSRLVFLSPTLGVQMQLRLQVRGLKSHGRSQWS
jgi:hypothetical protein